MSDEEDEEEDSLLMDILNYVNPYRYGTTDNTAREDCKEHILPMIVNCLKSRGWKDSEWGTSKIKGIINPEHRVFISKEEPLSKARGKETNIAFDIYMLKDVFYSLGIVNTAFADYLYCRDPEFKLFIRPSRRKNVFLLPLYIEIMCYGGTVGWILVAPDTEDP